MSDHLAPVIDLTPRLGRRRVRDNVAAAIVARQGSPLEPTVPPHPERVTPALWLGLVALVVIAVFIWGCGVPTEPPRAYSSSPSPGAAAAISRDLDRISARLAWGRERIAYWEGWKREPVSLEASR